MKHASPHKSNIGGASKTCQVSKLESIATVAGDRKQLPNKMQYISKQLCLQPTILL